MIHIVFKNPTILSTVSLLLVSALRGPSNITHLDIQV